MPSRYGFETAGEREIRLRVGHEDEIAYDRRRTESEEAARAQHDSAVLDILRDLADSREDLCDASRHRAVLSGPFQTTHDRWVVTDAHGGYDPITVHIYWHDGKNQAILAISFMATRFCDPHSEEMRRLRDQLREALRVATGLEIEIRGVANP